MRDGLTITPGVCLGCGCTDEDACFDEAADSCCWWGDEAQTWCSVCALRYGQAVIQAGAAMREEEQPVVIAA